MPDIGSRAAPAHTERNVDPTEHPFNTLPRTTFKNAPGPQWPLPKIPASCPIVPKDPVAVQSDEYSVWQPLGHFDALMKSLIREVYSPQYRIPAGSRSRFTGAIRETHTIEVVEAKRRRESAWSVASAEDSQAEPQLLSGTATNTSRVVEAERREPTTSGFVEISDAGSESHALPSRTTRLSKRKIVPERPSRLSKLRKSEPQYNPVLSLDFLSSADKADAFVDAEGGSANKEQGQKDQSMADKKPRFDLVLLESTRKADRNDVVDDLVRLWTLVR